MSQADGSHIQILWTSFIWKFMPDIIEHGYLYIPQPPLFQAKKKGQEPRFYYTTNELQEAQLDSSWEISRFKGLATKPSPYYLFRNTSGVARMCG